MPLVTRQSNLKGIIADSTQPTGPNEGDGWYDTANNILKIYDGSSWIEYQDLSTTQTNSGKTLTTPEIKAGQTLKPLLKSFTECATGNTIPVIWTQTNNTGTGVFSVLDGIDGGLKIATAAGTSNEQSNLNFNNKRNFDPANCTIYGIITSDQTTDCRILAGIASGTDPLAAATHSVFVGVYPGVSGFILLNTGDGATQSQSASDVAISTSKFPFKIICSSSNVKLYLLVGGVWTLKVTKTTNRPTSACQPCFVVGSEFAVTAVKSGVLSYLRVENDS